MFSKNIKSKNSLKGKRAFTYVELLTVIVILAVLVGVVHTVLVTNWFAYDERIVRADLWHESNKILEMISTDGRKSYQIDLEIEEELKSVIIFYDLSAPASVTYTMLDNGQLTVEREGNEIVVLTSNLDFEESFFEKENIALRVKLALKKKLFTREIGFNTLSEIYPRN